jgi:hypothetical protein
LIIDNIADYTVPSGYFLQEYANDIPTGSFNYNYFEYDIDPDNLDSSGSNEVSQSQVLTWTIYTGSISDIQNVEFAFQTASIVSNDFDITTFLSSSIFESDIFAGLNVNDIKFGTVKNVTPLSNTVDFIEVDEKLIRQRREVKIITSSLIGYEVPYWVKELTIVSIGGGGAGGAGVKTVLSGSEDRHYYSLGGAGGSGGNISYTTFTGLNTDANKSRIVSGSTTSFQTGSKYFVYATIGKVAKGGTAYTGSNTASYTDFTSHINSFTEELGNTMLKYIDSTDVIVGDNGENGSETLVILQEISTKTGFTELGRIGASGGVGGKGGVAFKTLDFPTGSFEEFKELIEKTPFIAFTQPGASFNNENNIGETILIGGPGGHGISLPVITGSAYTDYDDYAAAAPALPWGIRSDSAKYPYQYPKGIFRFPWGINTDNGQRDGMNYTKPSDFGATGGGGGLGWIKTNHTSGSMNSTISQKYTETGFTGGGKLLRNKTIFGNTLGEGGIGGINYSATTITPTTGSSFGAGGGGGASTNSSGTPQNGADGRKGAVLLIMSGEISIEQQNDYQ